MKNALLPLAVLLAAPAAAPAADEFVQHGAHEHGKATLDVAVDGGTVTLAFASPAVNLLGFERRPRTDAERQAVADATALLGRHAQLFAFPVAAGCAATGSKVTAPDWAQAGHDHDHGHAGEDGHAHADYAARWTFRCANPTALAFVDAPLVGRLGAGTVVEANVIAASLQTRQTLRAGSWRVRLR